MLARFGVFEWSLVASTETSDLIAELRRRGYAVAIVTPDELIETVENLDQPPRQFDTAEWLDHHRKLVEAMMLETARAVIIETTKPKN
jgi:hypothetical protein